MIMKPRIKIRSCVIVLAILAMTIVSANLDDGATNTTQQSITVQQAGLTSHAPISIDGNADFAAQASSEGCASDGTEANPYVIEGYGISACEIITQTKTNL